MKLISFYKFSVEIFGVYLEQVARSVFSISRLRLSVSSKTDRSNKLWKCARDAAARFCISRGCSRCNLWRDMSSSASFFVLRSGKIRSEFSKKTVIIRSFRPCRWPINSNILYAILFRCYIIPLRFLIYCKPATVYVRVHVPSPTFNNGISIKRHIHEDNYAADSYQFTDS